MNAQYIITYHVRTGLNVFNLSVLTVKQQSFNKGPHLKLKKLWIVQKQIIRKSVHT